MERRGVTAVPVYDAPALLEIAVNGGPVTLTPSSEQLPGRYLGSLRVQHPPAAPYDQGAILLDGPGSWQEVSNGTALMDGPARTVLDSAARHVPDTWRAQYDTWRTCLDASAAVLGAVRQAGHWHEFYLYAAASRGQKSLQELAVLPSITRTQQDPDIVALLNEADLDDPGLHDRLCAALGVDRDARDGALRRQDPSTGTWQEHTMAAGPYESVPIDLAGRPAYAGVVDGVGCVPPWEVMLTLEQTVAEHLIHHPPPGIQWVVWNPGQRLFDAVMGHWNPADGSVHAHNRYKKHPDAAAAEDAIRHQLLPTVDLDQHLARMYESRTGHFRDGAERTLREVRQALDTAAATALAAIEDAAARDVTRTTSLRDLLETHRG